MHRFDPLFRLFPLMLLPLMLGGVVLSSGCAHEPQIRDRRVVVMDFRFADPAHGLALADLMNAELVNYPRIAVMERQSLRGLMSQVDDQRLSLQSFGRRARVDYIILGSISRLDENYIVNTYLFSVNTGQVIQGSSVTRSCSQQEDLYPVVQRMAEIMAHHLGVLADCHDRLARKQPMDV